MNKYSYKPYDTRWTYGPVPTDAQCNCIICESRDIEVIERAMARVDAMQRTSVDRPPMWVGAVIIAAFAVWVVAMIVKTGGAL